MKRFFLWLKKTFSFPLLIIFISIVAYLFIFIVIMPTLRDVFLSFGQKLPAPIKFCFFISDHFQWLNHSLTFLLIFPLYLGLALFCEKITLKNKRLQNWLLYILLLILGATIFIIVFWMFMPCIDFGTLEE
jgi:type II secretory pathway component PulF